MVGTGLPYNMLHVTSVFAVDKNQLAFTNEHGPPLNTDNLNYFYSLIAGRTTVTQTAIFTVFNRGAFWQP